MEQEELTVDPHYLKGFNNGYLLSRHDPNLAAQLTARPNEHNEYFKGLVAGKKEYESEWARSFSKGAFKNDDLDIHKER